MSNVIFKNREHFAKRDANLKSKKLLTKNYFNMKKTFITVLLAVCCGLYSNAQNFSFGIKAGFSLSTMSHDEDPIETQHPFQPGVTAGFFGQYDFTDMFGLSTELLYGLQGFNSDMESFKMKNTILTHNLKIPVLLNVNLLDNKLNLQAGPQFGILLIASNIEKYSEPEFKNRTTLQQDYYNLFNIGATFGANYLITERVSAGLRYELGLTDNLTDGGGGNISSKNRVLNLMMGYRF